MAVVDDDGCPGGRSRAPGSLIGLPAIYPPSRDLDGGTRRDCRGGLDSTGQARLIGQRPQQRQSGAQHDSAIISKTSMPLRRRADIPPETGREHNQEPHPERPDP
jgi:hypothetical protein